MSLFQKHGRRGEQPNGSQELSPDQLEKRRSINRRSQQKSRENKEQLIKTLQEENRRLKEQLRSEAAPGYVPLIRKCSELIRRRQTPPYTSSSDSPSSLRRLPSSSTTSNFGKSPLSPLLSRFKSRSLRGSPTQSFSFPLHAGSVNLDASRQIFLAVLASVCDPHLNTIHAVAQKIAASRGHAFPSDIVQPTLAEPRPVDRPLNAWQSFVGQAWNPASHFSSTDDPPPLAVFDGRVGGLLPDMTSNPIPNIGALEDAHLHTEWFPPATTNIEGYQSVLPPSSFLGSSPGPLYVPYLEPSHPVLSLELDGASIWNLIINIVDLTRADAETIAAKLVPRVRCYGFGPVVFSRDVSEVCAGRLLAAPICSGPLIVLRVPLAGRRYPSGLGSPRVMPIDKLQSRRHSTGLSHARGISRTSEPTTQFTEFTGCLAQGTVGRPS